MANQSTEAYFYFVIAGLVGLVLYVVVSAFYAGISFARGRRPSFHSFIAIGLWFGLALLVGAVANSVWYSMFTERLYHDADPVVRFMPFLPFHLDTSGGGYFQPGVSLTTMELLWVSFAAPCWLVALAGTRWFRNRAAA